MKKSDTVDISKYIDKITNPYDKASFRSAMNVGKEGDLTLAFTRLWILCSESLERQFEKADKLGDDKANKFMSKIKKNKKGFERHLLEKAKENGFISEATFKSFSFFYNKRSTYVHATKTIPLPEEVLFAAAEIVEYLCSKEIEFNKKLATELLDRLLEKEDFKYSQQSKMKELIEHILNIFDKNILKWLLTQYLEKLEEIANHKPLKIFFSRGVSFFQTLLTEKGAKFFLPDEWHYNIKKFPKTLMPLCVLPEIYKDIGEQVQDSLIKKILSEDRDRLKFPPGFETLISGNYLSKSQLELVNQHILSMSHKDIVSNKLKTKTCYPYLIKEMKSLDWYRQNSAIKLIVSNGPLQAEELDKAQKVNLGRNILQCAEGESYTALDFLKELSSSKTGWPFDVLKGMALESFTNEDNEIRFKARYLTQVLTTISFLEEEKQEQIISEIVTSVNNNKWADSINYNEVIPKLKYYPRAKLLVDIFKDKKAEVSKHVPF